MTFPAGAIGKLLQGPLLAAGAWPFALHAALCDLRPVFLPKGSVGSGQRAVARNGRVLLASDRPLADLAGQEVRLRFQTWHKVILPGSPAEPYGILLCARVAERGGETPLYEARLVPEGEGQCDLALSVGALRTLAFQRQFCSS